MKRVFQAGTVGEIQTGVLRVLRVQALNEPTLAEITLVGRLSQESMGRVFSFPEVDRI